MITDPAQAEHILRTGQADLIFMAREMLRDPYWPLHAAAALGETARGPCSICAPLRAKSMAREPVGNTS